MNIWNKIDELIMRAVADTVYNIWGRVGIMMDYNEENKQIHLMIWDMSYTRDDKKVVVDKTFNYHIKDASNSEILDIVEYENGFEFYTKDDSGEVWYISKNVIFKHFAFGF